VPDEPVPALDEPVPEYDEPRPMPDEPMPVLDEPVPVLDEPLPAPDEPVPVLDEPVPVLDEPLPVLDEPLPMTDEPVPMPDEPVPVLDEPMPVLDEPLAELEEPLPEMEDPVPELDEPLMLERSMLLERSLLADPALELDPEVPLEDTLDDSVLPVGDGGAPLPSASVSSTRMPGSTLIMSLRVPALMTSDCTLDVEQVMSTPSTVATMDAPLSVRATSMVLTCPAVPVHVRMPSARLGLTVSRSLDSRISSPTKAAAGMARLWRRRFLRMVFR